eukprot:UN02581
MKFLAIIAILLAIAFCVSAEDVTPEYVFLRGTYKATKDGDLGALMTIVLQATLSGNSCQLVVDKTTFAGAYFNPPPTITMDSGLAYASFPKDTLSVDFGVYFGYNATTCTKAAAQVMLGRADELLDLQNIKVEKKNIVIEELADKKYDVSAECVDDNDCITNNCVEQTVVPTADEVKEHRCSAQAKYGPANSAIATGAGLFAAVVAAVAVFLM